MFDEQPVEVPSTFTVDQNCIDDGHSRSREKCMISLALLKEGCECPIVWENGMTEFKYKGTHYYSLPDTHLEDKIQEFDKKMNKKNIKPFAFSLDPIQGHPHMIWNQSRWEFVPT